MPTCLFVCLFACLLTFYFYFYLFIYLLTYITRIIMIKCSVTDSSINCSVDVLLVVDLQPDGT